MHALNAAVTKAVRTETPRSSRYQRHATARIATHFLGPGQVIALFSAMIAIGIVLFPRQFINQQLHAGGPPQAATIAYLALLLRAQPADATTRLQLGREQLRAGQLDRAEETLGPLVHANAAPGAGATALWLELRRARFVGVASGSPQREVTRQDYARALRRYCASLSPSDQLTQINQAIDAGLYSTAVKLAESLLRTGDGSASGYQPARSTVQPAKRRVLSEARLSLGVTKLVGLVWAAQSVESAATRDQTLVEGSTTADIRLQAFDAILRSQLAAGHPEDALQAAQTHWRLLDPLQVDWARLVKVATGAGQPTAAADFAQRWLSHARDDDSRWRAFSALINAYLGAGQPAEALAAAMRNIERMPPTTALWRVMTRLAMQAGDSASAADFARRLVHLGSAHDH